MAGAAAAPAARPPARGAATPPACVWSWLPDPAGLSPAGSVVPPSLPSPRNKMLTHDVW